MLIYAVLNSFPAWQCVFHLCVISESSTSSESSHKLPGPIREVATRQIIKDFTGKQTVITEKSELARFMVANPVVKETITVSEPTRNFIIKKDKNRKIPQSTQEEKPEFLTLKSTMDTKRREKTKSRIEKLLSKDVKPEEVNKQKHDYRKQLKSVSPKSPETPAKPITPREELLQEIQKVKRGEKAVPSRSVNIETIHTVQHELLAGKYFNRDLKPLKSLTDTENAHETTVDETTVNETAVYETTVNETTVYETTVGETTVGETTVDETTVDESTTGTSDSIQQQEATEQLNDPSNLSSDTEDIPSRVLDERSRQRMLKLIKPSQEAAKLDRGKEEEDNVGVLKALKLLIKEKPAEHILNNQKPRESSEESEDSTTSSGSDEEIIPDTKENTLTVDDAISIDFTPYEFETPAMSAERKERYKQERKQSMQKALEKRLSTVKAPKSDNVMPHPRNTESDLESKDEVDTYALRKSIEVHDSDSDYLEPVVSSLVRTDPSTKAQQQMTDSSDSDYLEPIPQKKNTRDSDSDYMEPLHRSSGESDSDYLEPVAFELKHDGKPNLFEFPDTDENNYVQLFPKEVDPIYMEIGDIQKSDDEDSDYLEPLPSRNDSASKNRKDSGAFESLSKTESNDLLERRSEFSRAASGNYEGLRISHGSTHDYSPLNQSDVEETEIVQQYKNGVETVKVPFKKPERISPADITWSMATNQPELSSEEDVGLIEEQITPEYRQHQVDINFNELLKDKSSDAINPSDSNHMGTVIDLSTTEKRNPEQRDGSENDTSEVEVEEEWHITPCEAEEDMMDVYAVIPESMPREKMEELLTLKYEADKSEKVEEVHMFDEVSVETKVTEVKTITMELSYLGDVSLQEMTEVHTDTDMKEYKKSVEKEQVVITHTVADKEAIDEASAAESSASEASPMLPRKIMAFANQEPPAYDRLRHDYESKYSDISESEIGEDVYHSASDRFVDDNSNNMQLEGVPSVTIPSTSSPKSSSLSNKTEPDLIPSEGEPEITSSVVKSVLSKNKPLKASKTSTTKDDDKESDSSSASSNDSTSTAYESETYQEKRLSEAESQELYDTSDAPSEGEPDPVTSKPIPRSPTRQVDTVRFQDGLIVCTEPPRDKKWDQLGALSDIHLDHLEAPESISSLSSFDSTNVVPSETDPDTLSQCETLSSRTDSTLRSESPISQPVGLEDIPEEDTSDLQSSKSNRSSEKHIDDVISANVQHMMGFAGPSTEPLLDQELGDVYVAMSPYEPESDEVMSLHEGEKVEILDDTAEDWWLVRKYFDQREGWVPGQYLKNKSLYDQQINEELHRIIGEIPLEGEESKVIFNKNSPHLFKSLY